MKILNNNKLSKLHCTGWSMYPTLKNDDFVYYESVEMEKLKRGDIIVYEEGQLNVCHRLVEMNKKYFFTRGDNSTSRDRPHEWKYFLGKVEIIRDKYGIVKDEQRMRRVMIKHFENVYGLFVLLKHLYYRKKV